MENNRSPTDRYATLDYQDYGTYQRAKNDVMVDAVNI